MRLLLIERLASCEGEIVFSKLSTLRNGNLLWRHRDYRRLWVANASSGIGDGVTATAAPLLAASLSNSAQVITGVTVSMTLPFLLFGLHAGALVDRVDRRKLMVRVDGIRCILLAIAAVSIWFNVMTIWLLYALMFLIGAGETFFRTAAQTIVPEIVPDDGLTSANSGIIGIQNVTVRFLGPLVGSLVTSFAMPVAYLVDSVSYAVSCWKLSRISLITNRRRRYHSLNKGGNNLTHKPSSLTSETITGLRWLINAREIRTFAAQAFFINLVVFSANSVLVIYVVRQLRMPPTLLGVLISGEAAGAIIAAVAIPMISKKIRHGQLIIVILSLFCAGSAVLYLTSMLAVAMLGMSIIACASVGWDVVAVEARQRLVPRELLGRVNSSYRMIAWSGMPIGALLGGWITAAMGVSSVFLLGSAVGLTSVFCAVIRYRGLDRA